jgi:hypothetical protein
MINCVERTEIRSLSEAELDTVGGGCCDINTYEVKCPIGNLLVVANTCGSEPIVAYYPR